jgi:hypothetical protein
MKSCAVLCVITIRVPSEVINESDSGASVHAYLLDVAALYGLCDASL